MVLYWLFWHPQNCPVTNSWGEDMWMRISASPSDAVHTWTAGRSLGPLLLFWNQWNHSPSVLTWQSAVENSLSMEWCNPQWSGYDTQLSWTSWDAKTLYYWVLAKQEVVCVKSFVKLPDTKCSVKGCCRWWTLDMKSSQNSKQYAITESICSCQNHTSSRAWGKT